MFAAPVLAQKKSRMQDAARHASEAAETFTEIMNVREKSIPKELLDKAEAIAVFPGVVKAAFIVGGRGGQGHRPLGEDPRHHQPEERCLRRPDEHHARWVAPRPWPAGGCHVSIREHYSRRRPRCPAAAFTRAG